MFDFFCPLHDFWLDQPRPYPIRADGKNTSFADHRHQHPGFIVTVPQGLAFRALTLLLGQNVRASFSRNSAVDKPVSEETPWSAGFVSWTVNSIRTF